MKVLFVAAEGEPFSKSGGLGDVVGSLPMELKKNGIDIRVILPKYKSIPQQYIDKMSKKAETTVKLGWRNQHCGIEELEHNGIVFYFVDNQYYFDRDRLYGYYDEAERYSYFSRAVLEALPLLDFFPDIIHCHDWHTGMISVLLKNQYQNKSLYRGIATLYTIHNLKFQGVFPKEVLGDLLDMEENIFNEEGVEFYDCVNFMKGGLVYSDTITTVSESYAKEIQTPYFGEKLDGLLRKKSSSIFGIINGIDYEEYNPRTDKYLYHRYDSNSLLYKEKNKEELQKELGLEVTTQSPIIAIISRLTNQKGLDLIEVVLDELLQNDIQVVVLGTGEPRYEDFFSNMSYKYPKKLSANITFDNSMAHKIYGSSDMLLMPSLFEPCGLSQLIALRYGTIPIVRETGGLKDTIRAYNEFSGEGNGFSFANYNAQDMLYTINRAVEFFKDKETWTRLIIGAMNEDLSWSNSAKKYHQLYQGLLSKTTKDKDGEESGKRS